MSDGTARRSNDLWHDGWAARYYCEFVPWPRGDARICALRHRRGRTRVAESEAMTNTLTDRSTLETDRITLRSNVLGRYRLVSASIAGTDGLSIAVAMLIAYVTRFGLDPMPRDFTLLIASAPLVFVAIFSAFRLYSIQLITPADEFGRIIAAVGSAIAAIALFGFWSQIPYSRLWLGTTWILATLCCLIVRQRWHRAMRRMRIDGRLTYRTLVVGANEEARGALEAFRSPALGFRPVAIVASEIGDGQRVAMTPDDLARIPTDVTRNVEALRRIILELAVDCVFVASTAVTPDDMARIVKAARLEGVEVRLSVNLPHILPTRVTAQPLDGLTAISLQSARLSGGRAAAKRAVDILGASVALLITLPVCMGIALAVKLTSHGPLLFRQTRVGRRRRPFTLLKFRTMIPGAEGMLIDLRDRNEADGPLFKIRDDPRVTSVGRWLRRWSLDELPQLVNVLKGDMSLVGPRPPLPEEVKRYEEWQYERFEVAPGLTGVWQVEGRIEMSFEDSIRRDIFYIENWSLSYDAFILAKTIPAVLSRKGAC
jgi:exopolysaccharide biosynthesis polyprenyl glycosylphosphotransferase